ncbi:MAG TPA: hypothetical protein VMS23_06990 [Terrimicrobiaceae bacterium]|jgi:hypothetical protein|nr:hypothetical protein [Terrimicrobiaceae bacterium]
MPKFVYLTQSKTYLNLDHVTAVKVQKESGQDRAEVLLAGIDRPELISDTDVELLLVELNKKFE